MILSEKILNQRKKSGWSQEELADKLNVSRQSISKWESSASIPDINKIIEMSKLFGISTDYLLKDDLEIEEYTPEDKESLKRISLSEATGYIEASKKYAKQLALGVMMCILSPVLLILLAGTAEYKLFGNALSENLAAGIGIVALLCIVACAVAIFIISSEKMKAFKYLDAGEFELEYGVSGIIKEKQQQYRSHYITNIVIGVVLCILCVCPLLIAGVAGAAEMLLILFTDLLLLIVSIAVLLFVYSETIRQGYCKLLLEDEFELAKKEKNQKFERFSGAYWPAVVLVYLAWSFLSNDWNITWIIWPVSALLFACLSAAFNFDNK